MVVGAGEEEEVEAVELRLEAELVFDGAVELAGVELEDWLLLLLGWDEEDCVDVLVLLWVELAWEEVLVLLGVELN